MEENNILQWNGNLIIKDGVYQNMFTTFKIMIPLTYPTDHPNVFFAPGIVHPLIDQVNGEFDIKVYIIVYNVETFPYMDSRTEFFITVNIRNKRCFFKSGLFQS